MQGGDRDSTTASSLSQRPSRVAAVGGLAAIGHRSIAGDDCGAVEGNGGSDREAPTRTVAERSDQKDRTYPTGDVSELEDLRDRVRAVALKELTGTRGLVARREIESVGRWRSSWMEVASWSCGPDTASTLGLAESNSSLAIRKSVTPRKAGRNCTKHCGGSGLRRPLSNRSLECAWFCQAAVRMRGDRVFWGLPAAAGTG